MRETVKALNTTFTAPNVPYPLPDELCATIENFLERYDNIDDHDSQRFHEDLHTLYQRQVAPSPEKHDAFLAVLRCVRPAIIGEARLTTWWNLVLKPTIDAPGHKRQELEDAREIVLSILVFDAEADKDGEHSRLSKLFTKRILDAYVARTNVPLVAEDTISPGNELLAQELESVLVAFGRKMPKVPSLNAHVNCITNRSRPFYLLLTSCLCKNSIAYKHSICSAPSCVCSLPICISSLRLHLSSIWKSASLSTHPPQSSSSRS